MSDKQTTEAARSAVGTLTRRCASCGVAWENHTGIAVTCERLRLTLLREERTLAWCEEAYRRLTEGVELMPLDRLSRWEGVQATMEDCPADVS